MAGNDSGSVIGKKSRRRTNVHVMPTVDNRWMIFREGNKRPTKYLSTQCEAIAIGRDLARQDAQQLVIYNQKGVMRITFNYDV